MHGNHRLEPMVLVLVNLNLPFGELARFSQSIADHMNIKMEQETKGSRPYGESHYANV